MSSVFVRTDDTPVADLLDWFDSVSLTGLTANVIKSDGTLAQLTIQGSDHVYANVAGLYVERRGQDGILRDFHVSETSNYIDDALADLAYGSYKGNPFNIPPATWGMLTARDRSLVSSLHSFSGARSRWIQYRDVGLSDDDLKVAISREYGIQGGRSGSEYLGFDEHSHKGGQEPAFWYGTAVNRGKPTLKGCALVNAVWHVLDVPFPNARQLRMF